VVLLSGGIDSATVAMMAVRQGFSVHAITFSYGQRHAIEIDCARRVAAQIGIAGHIVIDLNHAVFASSSLVAESGIPVPHGRDYAHSADIPSTYVPARNILFLSYALAYGETVGAHDIFIGVNAIDYSGYPDCRPEFIEAFARMADLGTRSGAEGRGFVIHAPLVDMTKAEIIAHGHALGVDYSLTHSCYDPDREGRSCGTCDSCRIRRAGFSDAHLADPTRYRSAS